MFADSLLETSWSQRTRRSWTTLTSFGVEAMAIGLLLLLPLWRTVGLPTARVVSTPISAAVRTVSETALQPRAGSSSNIHATVLPGRIMQPSHVPTTIENGGDDPESLAPVGQIGIGTGEVNLPIGSGNEIPFMSGTHAVMPVRPAATVPRFRTSKLLEGNLIRKVPPVYPPLARSARIQGSVVVYALISKAGTIENLQVLSGHPMLAGSAIEAIRQWRYRPYILNGEPIEVETQITVSFSLAN